MLDLTKPLNLIQSDCLHLLKQLPDQSIDLIVTDPPYYKVKGCAWDHQWQTEQLYFVWLEQVVQELVRVMKRNGSLYLFCSTNLYYDTHTVVAKHLQILNHVLWVKKSGRFSGCHKPNLRRYFAQTESIIFAERLDAIKPKDFCCEAVRDYLAENWTAAGFKYRDAEMLCGSTARHFFTKSQWSLPSPENYALMQQHVGQQYLTKSWQELRDIVVSAKLGMTDKKQGLRYFHVPNDASMATRPHTNIWQYPVVEHYEGKHPCEKPAPLLEHILLTSSKEGDLVLDVFAGSCSTANAALKLGRRFVGCDLDDQYFSQLK